MPSIRRRWNSYFCVPSMIGQLIAKTKTKCKGKNGVQEAAVSQENSGQ